MSDKNSVGQVSLALTLDTSGLENQIRSAANSIRSEMEGGLSGLSRQIQNSAGSVKSSVDNISSSLKRIAGLVTSAFAVTKIIQFGRSCLELGSDLSEMQNVSHTVFPTMTAEVDEWSKTMLESAGLSETMAQHYAGTFGSMAKSFGFSEQEAYDMSTAMTQLTGDVASFYNLSQDEAFTRLKSVFTGETETLKELGVVMTQSALDQYALANGYGKTTSAMTEQEKVALRLAFVESKLSQASEDFLKTQDSWANQTRLLKSNIQALNTVIGQTMINAFKPMVKAMNAALKQVLSFVETVSNALGKIFGWKIQVDQAVGDAASSASGLASDLADSTADAADSAGDVGNAGKGAAKGLSDANKQAKALARTLMGFDEINKLNDTSDSGSSGSGGSGGSGGNGSGGGGSGGSGGTPDIGTVGTAGVSVVKTDTIFKDYESSIDNLRDLGAYISDALSDAMESIDWESIYEKARNFGKGLADFLNGLITPRLFYDLGKTIAGCLNTALEFLNSFGQEFDWSNFGASLAAGLIGFFENFNWTLLGQAITTWATGLFDAMSAFLQQKPWETLLYGVHDTLIAIDFSDIGTSIANTLWSAFSTTKMSSQDQMRIQTSLQSLEDAFDELTNFSFTAITDFYNNVLVPLGQWTITEALPQLSDIITEHLGKVDWDTLNSGLNGLYSVVVNVAEGFGQGIIDFLKGLVEAYDATIGAWIRGIADALSKLDGTMSSDMEDNFKSFGHTLGTLFAALVAFKAGKSIFDGMSKIKDGLAVLVTFATTHPIAAIAISLGALAVALGSIAKTNIDRTKFGPFTKEISELSKTLDTYADTVKNRLDDIDQSYSDAGTGEAEYVEGLWKEYQKLAGQSKKSNDEISRMKDIAGIIAQYCPEANQYIDAQTGLFTDQYEEIQKCIDKTEEYYKQQAAQELILEAYKARAEAEKAMADAQTELDKIQAQYNDDLDKYNAIMNDSSLSMTGRVNQSNDLMTELVKLSDAQDAVKDSLAETSDQYTRSNNEIQTLTDSIGGLSNASKEVDYRDMVLNAADAIDQMGGIFVDGQQVLGQDAAELYMAVMAGLDPGQTVDGKSAYDLGNGVVVSFGEGMADGGALAQSTGASVATLTYDELASHVSSFGKIGEQYSYATAEGITDAQDTVTDAAESNANAAADSTSSTSQARQKQLKTQEYNQGVERGESGAQGEIDGIDGKKSELAEKSYSASKESADAGVKAIQDVNSDYADAAYDNGETAVDQNKQGASDSIPDLDALYAAMPQGMVDAMGDLAKRFSTIGKHIISNLLSGLKATQHYVTDQMSTLTAAMVRQAGVLPGQMYGIGQRTAAALASGMRSIHIPAPHFNVGTRGVSAAGVGFALPQVSVSWLANGSFVKRNTPQLAVVGDNRHEGEIVSPESRMEAMAEKAASLVGGQGNQQVVDLLQTLISLVQGGGDVVLNVDGEELARAQQNGALRLKRRYTTAAVSVS